MMFLSTPIPLMLLLIGMMATSVAVAHADTPPPAGQTLTALQVQDQVAGVIYRKALPDGRSLSVSRTKLPPDPQTIAGLDNFKKAIRATKGFPPNATPLYPDYSWLYSFDVSGSKDKPVTLWTRRADHFPSLNYTEIDWSTIRMRDAILENRVLVLVFKQTQNTFAVVILPDTKNGPQMLPQEGSNTRLAVDKDDEHGRVFMQTAQITGSYSKKTLAVELTFTDGTKEHFDWKAEGWVKSDTSALK